jgi:hypothetical protein
VDKTAKAGAGELAIGSANLLRLREEAGGVSGRIGTNYLPRCVMQPGKPESWSHVLQLPSLPDHLIKVTVSARCPQCSGTMQLGSTQDGAAMFYCPACQHQEVHKHTTSEAIAREACRYVAEKP